MPLRTSRGRLDLRAPFERAAKPREDWRVGLEAEKFGIARQASAPLQFTGEHGIEALLGRLVEHKQWQPSVEYEGGPVVSLVRGASSITLEPGGQVELSSAPAKSLVALRDELQQHLNELEDVGHPQTAWLSLGFHPFALPEELPWVPKLRYPIMREHMPKRGLRSLDMMQRTCTAQVNFDYSSEEDALRKMRVSLALQPVVTAMFANSVFAEGVRSDLLCQRADVWLHMDRDRSGLISCMWSDKADLETYIDWALDVPMFLIRRGERVLRNTGQTFREFLAEGCQGEVAGDADWSNHLKTLFPEARLKETIEVRGADAQDVPLTCSLMALWKGLLYDETSLEEAHGLAASLDVAEVQRQRPKIARYALRAELGGRSLLHWAERLVALAEEGLSRMKQEEEAAMLAPLKHLLAEGICPSERMLRQIDASKELRPQVVDLATPHGLDLHRKRTG